MTKFLLISILTLIVSVMAEVNDTLNTICFTGGIRCGKTCCSTLILNHRYFCADPSISLCCLEGTHESNGICCPTGTSNSNGICCESGLIGSDSICCAPTAYNSDGICCEFDSVNSGGICCPASAYNSGGICCPLETVNSDGLCCEAGSVRCGSTCCSGICRLLLKERDVVMPPQVRERELEKRDNTTDTIIPPRFVCIL